MDGNGNGGWDKCCVKVMMEIYAMEFIATGGVGEKVNVGRASVGERMDGRCF